MSKLNPQNATAYVGPGVLRKGGKITPVPNGPLIKKKGPFKGSTLKAGGKIKKAQVGINIAQREADRVKARVTNDSLKNERRKVIWKKSYETSEGKKKGQDFDTWYKEFDNKTKENSAKAPEPRGERTFFAGDNGPKSPCKGGKCSGLNRNGGKIKKAQGGLNLVDVTPKSKNDTVAKKPVQNWVNNPNGGRTPYVKLAKKIDKKKAGGMIKRADGSYSKRGLWDNIRANKGSGKKPTKQMLVQEKKIKAKSKK